MAKSNATSFFKGMKKEYSFELGCDPSVFNKKNKIYSTPYPVLNFMLSGDFFGGLEVGKCVIYGGKRASFKSNLLLICAKSVLQANPNAYILFYDSESVATLDNFEKVGINLDQLIEPRKICDIEMLSELILNDTLNIIQAKGNEDKTFVICIDGVGMLADSSTITKSIDGEQNNQMGMRAKRLNEIASHIMTVLNHHNVIVLVANHVYDEMGKMYARQVFKGGEGFLNIADTAILMSQKNISAEKNEETNIANGSIFTMQAAKSRSISKDFKLELSVDYTDGILPFSGLFDLLQRMSKHLKQVSAQKYSLINEDGEILEYNGKLDFKKSDVEHSTDFWRFVFKNTSFTQEVKDKVSLKEKKLIDEKALDSWSLINELKGE